MSFNVLPSEGPKILNLTFEICSGKYEDFNMFANTLYCNWTFDKFLCWPPTKAGEVALQKCPATKGLDSSKFAERRCSSEGKWEGKPGSESLQGWTNYTNCYLPEVLELLRKLGNSKEIKMNIAETTRILEIFGFALSLIALVISLVIFYRFR